MDNSSFKRFVVVTSRSRATVLATKTKKCTEQSILKLKFFQIYFHVYLQIYVGRQSAIASKDSPQAIDLDQDLHLLVHKSIRTLLQFSKLCTITESWLKVSGLLGVSVRTTEEVLAQYSAEHSRFLKTL